MSRQTIITRLELHNFKGVANRVVEFNREGTTTISGRNATGKTTIMDAFTWLLWGVNSEDKGTSSFDIKPNDENGQPRLDLDTEVTGVIEVLDTETGVHQAIELKRRWASQWRTRKGEIEREFVGNKGEYFVNDVPTKESEYKEAVASIIPPEAFKVITNPYYFPRLPWQARRQALLSLIPEITDSEIAADVPEFEKLIGELNGKSLEERSKLIGAAINRINAELDKIPVQIQEAQHNMPEAPDFEVLAIEKQELENQLDAIETMMLNSNEAARRRNNRSAEINREIESLRKQQAEVVAKAQKQAWEEAQRRNQRRMELLSQLQEARFAHRRDESSAQADIEQLKLKIKNAEDYISQRTEEQNELRRQWEVENAKEYSQDAVLICPITGHACADQTACYEHATNWHEARAQFIRTQEEKKAEITKKGQALGQQISDAKAELQRRMMAKDEAEAKLAKLAATPEAVVRLEQELAATPEISIEQVDSASIPEYAELQKRIEELPNQLDEVEVPTATTDVDLRARRVAFANQLDEVKRKLNLKSIIEAQERRIEELQAAEKKLRQEKADLQKEQAIADRFTKARMQEVESRVNALFSSVRFQMFEPTTTTNDEKQACVCWIGEAKYNDKNKAGKVNAGLDIINTFCRHYKITAPIFIDNAESVNTFAQTDSQLVLLQVSTEDFNIQ